MLLENELVLDNMEKEANFVNFKIKIISDLIKIINEKIKTELKTFKIESLKHQNHWLGTKNQTNLLKDECKLNCMIIAKLSRTVESLTRKKIQVIWQDVKMNSNPPPKEPDKHGVSAIVWFRWNSRRSGRILKHPAVKINLKQQPEQVWLLKRLTFIKYQSQQLDKNSQGQDIHHSGTCIILGDLILNGLIEENHLNSVILE